MTEAPESVEHLLIRLRSSRSSSTQPPGASTQPPGASTQPPGASTQPPGTRETVSTTPQLRQWADPDSRAGASDVDALVSAWTDAEIARWNPVPEDPSPGRAARWIAGTRLQHSKSPSIDLVLCSVSGVLLGELGFRIDHDRRIAEIGFWIAAEHRRDGHALSLLGLVGQIAALLDIERTFAITDVANGGAIRLLQRAMWREVATKSKEHRAFLCPTARIEPFR